MALVGAYTGTIVCDALSTHGAGARASPQLTLAGCWAHVFREFEEAAPDHPEATQALAWIGALYEIDTRAQGDLAQLAALRRTESAAVLAQIQAWLWELAALTSLSIGKAAAYAISNWERLTRFVDDARIPLDNNATERAIRGPVVGRKNHDGSKSRRGTEVAATLYTGCRGSNAGALRVEPRVCAVARPEHKGKVERAIRYLRDRFLAGRTIPSVEDGNRALARFIAEIAHARPHPVLAPRTVGEVFADLPRRVQAARPVRLEPPRAHRSRADRAPRAARRRRARRERPARGWLRARQADARAAPRPRGARRRLHRALRAARAALADLRGQESMPAFERRLRRYLHPDVLILDELGYLPCDSRAADILYAIINRRHEKRSTMAPPSGPALHGTAGASGRGGRRPS